MIWIIPVIIFGVVFMVSAAILAFSGSWVQRPKVDWERLDELEKEVGIGPPYSSEFPKLREKIEERIW